MFIELPRQLHSDFTSVNVEEFPGQATPVGMPPLSRLLLCHREPSPIQFSGFPRGPAAAGRGWGRVGHNTTTMQLIV
jgi:hypothetical protein